MVACVDLRSGARLVCGSASRQRFARVRADYVSVLRVYGRSICSSNFQ